MAHRYLLHLSKLDDFAAWAATLGYVREAVPAKAEYMVLKLRRGSEVLDFYKRDTATEHASAPDKAVRLIHRWIRERGRVAP